MSRAKAKTCLEDVVTWLTAQKKYMMIMTINRTIVAAFEPVIRYMIATLQSSWIKLAIISVWCNAQQNLPRLTTWIAKVFVDVPEVEAECHCSCEAKYIVYDGR